MHGWHGACFALGADFHINQETIMRIQISSKLAALGLALLMNSMIIGGVSQLFSSHVVERGTALAAERVPPHSAGAAA
jgi:predicted phage tail protein